MRKCLPIALLSISAVVSLVLFASMEASAQSPLHRVELFAEGGASLSNKTEFTPTGIAPPPFPTITTRESLRTTGRLFVGMLFRFDRHEALEASYSYSPSDLLTTTACNPNCGTSSGFDPMRVSFFAGNYVRSLPTIARLRPFLTAGLGVVIFHNLFSTPTNGSPFAANFGGGFDYVFSRHWAARAEYRDWLFQFPQLGFRSTPSGFTHNSAPTVGVVFRF